MIKTVSFLGALAMLVSASLPAVAMTEAEVRECKAMADSIRVRQGEVQTMLAQRDRALETVELAGEQWDDVEIHRNASTAHAVEADKRKAIYDAQKVEFMKLDAALQSKNRMVTQSVVQYNARCVPAD
ncbi:MAG: hypothetical protein QNI84_15580 [Henriciella sp.]|nr:hypothetical protein [Henriciella sp.]